ncbi:dnaj-like protein subfamily b member 8-like protein [Moniliophthora roreri MCA 2997]|uniref:Dnaj-like protein subfamily b member 8-like protein n=1 Tax=Moniliophthora roreri (strain MCA 2997) TaxID=1381753 RepID=V2XY18_MONRO|nr:dnaj-like protein subfamily b member 8-like protein [Moniliophthora roreri MCA 2997]
MSNFYEILGLQPSASSDEVRKAYKLKALETHPDKLDHGASQRDKEAAEKRFHQVHEAFETLSDPIKRRAYDARTFRSRTDSASSFTSEDVERRKKERAEWARQQEERFRLRREGAREVETSRKPQLKEKIPSSVPPTGLNSSPEPQVVDEKTKLVEQLMADLRQMNPEWEMRRKNVLQRRAERLRANISHTLRS